mgnify:CR=1 FL=1
MSAMILQANALNLPLADGCVQTCVTSPPYWGLRDYGVPGQLGLEPTPDEYVANMVNVFREVWRVLRDDGTLWLNLGDSFFGSQQTGGTDSISGNGKSQPHVAHKRISSDLKPKDLCGIPWRVAFALQQPFYAGKIRREVDRIWLAAMIDAEGCIYIHKRKAGQDSGEGYLRQNDTYGAGVEVANTSEAIVNRCMEIAGVGSISRQDKDRRQPLYRWHVRTNECRDVLREIYPYLIAKQHQARLAYGCPTSGDKAEQAHAALMLRHGGSDTDIDFAPPASMFSPGWYLRSDVIWAKPNPMPESVTDRPTKAHEYIFLLSKSARYYYDAEAVKEAAAGDWHGSSFTNERDLAVRPTTGMKPRGGGFSRKYAEQQPAHGAMRLDRPADNGSRNRRTVWTIATAPYSGAHFATFPPKLVEPCILAGTSERGCCPACGAPWERVVERENNGRTFPGDGLGWDERKADGKGGSGGHVASTTTGWRPTCACTIGSEMYWCDTCDITKHVTELAGGCPKCGETMTPAPFSPVPCLVLDPFNGSGTTGRVAVQHRRRYVGTELNPDYIALAHERTGRVQIEMAV